MSRAPDAPVAPQYGGGCRIALIIRPIMGVGLEEKEKREPIMKSIFTCEGERYLWLVIWYQKLTFNLFKGKFT